MRRRTTMVIVDGREVYARDIKTDHDVDQGVATGAVTVRTPRPHQADPGAPVEIYSGYDGATWPVFSGKVAEYAAGYDRSGSEVRVELEGYGKHLYHRYREARGFNGPLPMDRWWRSLCAIQGVPHYHADTTTDIHGTVIQLGDNPDYEGGWIPIEPDSPGDQIDRVVRHFGYRSFETPYGQRLQRISGLPTEHYSNLVQYRQGVNIERVERVVSDAGMANVVDIRGAKFQRPDTSEAAIRSFTGTYVPDYDRFGPTGMNTFKPAPDPMLGSAFLANAAREAYENDLSGQPWRYEWTVPGDPERIPGDQVAVWSELINGSTSRNLIDELIGILPRALWLTRVSHTMPGTQGWTTTLQGWAGTGQVMPAGDDTDEYVLLGEQGVHIGNERLEHYRNPAPIGAQYDIPFSVPETYATLTIRGLFHGANSFVRNAESSASKFEIWQFGERVASGEMPRSDENLERRYPYDDGRVLLEDGGMSTNINYFWSTLVVPLTGSLEAGSATLKIIAGEDRDVGDIDDYEVCNLVLHAGGTGTPAPLG